MIMEKADGHNEQWVDKKLIELADYYNGMAFKPSDWSDDGVKIIRIEQLNNPLGDYDHYKGTFPEINAIQDGDLIFSWSATLKVAIWKWGDGVLNQHLFKVVPFEDIDKYFLYFLLDYNMPKLGESSHGSTMKHIKRKELETYSVSIPESLPAQRRIAAILSAADKVIEQTRQLICKYKSIKQGMMEDLLKPKEGWKKVRFDVFFEMLPTNTLSRDNLNNQQGVYQNIHYGDVLIKYPFCMSCDENEIPYINEGVKFNIAEIKDGDVIFADTAEDDTVGKCIEVMDVRNRKIVSGLHTYFCRPNFKMELGYLGYFLNSNHFHNQLLPYIAGSKVSSVNRNSISRTYIFYPDLPEQHRIAKILSGIDKKIEAEEKVLEKYTQIKKGLMEKILKEN